MSIHLTGEDGCTLFALTTPACLDNILADCGIHSLEHIWFRPSFGRGAGTTRNHKEGGYSGFGEPDAMFIGTNSDRDRIVVFLESKSGRADAGEVNSRQLRYQFFLKYALILAMLNPVELKRGTNQDAGIYYHIGLPGNPGEPLAAYLNNLYQAYKPGAPDRQNGWLLKVKPNFSNAPALADLQAALAERGRLKVRIRFFALGFTRKLKQSGPLDLFSPITYQVPPDHREIFCEEGQTHLPVRYRNIPIQEPVELATLQQ